MVIYLQNSKAYRTFIRQPTRSQKKNIIYYKWDDSTKRGYIAWDDENSKMGTN
jgi:hypothetical protein